MYLRGSFLLFTIALAILCLQVHGKIYFNQLPDTHRVGRVRPYGGVNPRGYGRPNPYFGNRAGNLVGNSAYGPSYAPQSSYGYMYGGQPSGAYQGYDDSGYGQQEQDFSGGAPGEGQGGLGGYESNQGNYGPGPGGYGSDQQNGSGPAGDGGGQSGYNQGPGGYGNQQGQYGAQPGGSSYGPGNFGSNNNYGPQQVPVGPGPVGFIPAAQSLAQANAQALSTAPFGFPVFPSFGVFPSRSYAQATANSFAGNRIVPVVPPVVLPAQSNANSIAQNSAQGIPGPDAPQVLPQDPAASDDSDTRTTITGTGPSQAPVNANGQSVRNGGGASVENAKADAPAESVGANLVNSEAIPKADASNNIITF